MHFKKPHEHALHAKRMPTVGFHREYARFRDLNRGVKIMGFVRSAALGLGVVFASGVVHAQGYPERQVRLIVPLPPGGISDYFGRMVAAQLQKKWNRPVVVENLPGGGTTIGMAALARSKADGYTIGLSNIASHSINPALMTSLSYDPVKDFEAIAIVAETANFLVVNPKKVPVKTVSELIDYARKNPGKINFASTGAGGSTHMAIELLMAKTGIKMVHVPYAGTAPSLTALLGGVVDIASTDPGTVRPHIANGTLLLLGSYAAKRTSIDPNVPALSETVPGVEITTWNGIHAPAGTPSDIIRKIADDLREFLTSSEVRDDLAKRGAWHVQVTPAELRNRVEAEVALYKKIGQDAGIKVQQ